MQTFLLWDHPSPGGHSPCQRTEEEEEEERRKGVIRDEEEEEGGGEFTCHISGWLIVCITTRHFPPSPPRNPDKNEKK